MRITNYKLRITICSFVVFIFFANSFSQTNPNFNIFLDGNYSSAEKMLDLYERRMGNAEDIASDKGNMIALSTSLMIEDKWENGIGLFKEHISKIKSGEHIENDILQLQSSQQRLKEMRDLLEEIKKRNFNRRVVATVEQLFPSNAKIDVNIPMYIVAFGTEKVDAFVRRIVWENNVPRFVGEGEGELTIVINLSGAVEREDGLESRFIGVLSTVAHEVFHAAFGNYQDRSKRWKQFRKTHNAPLYQLLELVQNEGIAYYFSLEQRGRGYLPRDWNEKTREAFQKFNLSAEQLLQENISPSRAFEIIRKANTSGFWESYGSISGMVMARAIETNLGHAALQETIAKGVGNFFEKYSEAIQHDGNLPNVDKEVLEKILEK